ncbi:MAG: GNAT family N-acetyltransferase [Pirellulaceae bacterium]
MTVNYYKRYRMDVDLARTAVRRWPLPDGYCLIPWSSLLIEAHADVKYRSFRMEVDAHVFPCLGEADGCVRLMNEISQRDGFLPGATWLAGWVNPFDHHLEYVGTIQGVRDLEGMGGIQNIGVVPEHRGRGIGRALIMQALLGFDDVNLRRVYLEVTARNVGAIRLYRRLGFRQTRTVYKAVEAAYT